MEVSGTYSSGNANQTTSNLPRDPNMYTYEIEPPSELEFALGVAKNMFEDLVPPERRLTVVGVGLGLLGFFLLFSWWKNRFSKQYAVHRAD